MCAGACGGLGFCGYINEIAKLKKTITEIEKSQQNFTSCGEIH